MQPPVFLTSRGELETGAVVLSGAEGRHAAAARRLRPGERADLADGAGALAQCVVTAVTPDSVSLAVQTLRVLPRPEPRVTVVQALPKGDRGELAIEMMTEVGVDTVIPWAAARCVARWQGDRGTRALGRWRSAAREAAKQARRAWLPEVTEPQSLAGVAARVSAAACAVVLEPDAQAPLSGVTPPEAGEIVLVVGPEGGISPEERAALAAAGAAERQLGPTVLRTSTAGAVAAGILLSRSGRWLGTRFPRRRASVRRGPYEDEDAGCWLWLPFTGVWLPDAGLWLPDAGLWLPFTGVAVLLGLVSLGVGVGDGVAVWVGVGEGVGLTEGVGGWLGAAAVGCAVAVADEPGLGQLTIPALLVLPVPWVPAATLATLAPGARPTVLMTAVAEEERDVTPVRPGP
ncbi:MAG: 16S rRNA (uracil(1498)-N(3))-methyltransferase [Streptosporangiaceae bacterium]|nr:16S rRNA (uracil(1498)-N(3))-methyltransferase [Streptosporangiaceae bacterium]MBV9854733.1 16S rRNA (uracil(1498)-N(3))-methyltransferase [Streptosporangiaceae bacterium]